MKNAKLLNFGFVAATIAGCFLLAHALETHPPSSAETPADASALTLYPAPDFTFQTLGNKKHRLSEFKGKYVVLNFWASWCGACAVEMPHLLQLARDHSKNTVLVALSIDEDTTAMHRFLTRFNTEAKTIFIGQDAGKHISEDLFQTFRVPETVLIDPEGRLVQKFVGAEFDIEALGQKLGK